MGLFKRMRNLLKAKGNAALDKIENPAELLDQKIRDMEDSFNQAKLSASTVLGNLHSLENQIGKAKDEAHDFDNKVRLALSKGNEELAKKALSIKLTKDKKVDALQAQYTTAKTNADKLKEKLKAMEVEIDKQRAYRDTAIARYESAKANIRVNEIIADIDAGGNNIKVSDIERKIEQKESLADGLADIAEPDSLEKEFDKLGEADIDKELEKYKENLGK